MEAAASVSEAHAPRRLSFVAPDAFSRLWEIAAPLAVASMAALWAVTFVWLSVVRHLAGGSHAEDLGFTEQVLWNFLRGQWFRMSIYSGATWNTELDISRVARPDSLLAFHFEPMLLLLVPLYALGGATALLVVQALAIAGGAIPAFRIGRHATQSTAAGVAVAAAYLLSPFGQWAALSDFHTSTLAAPLLLLAVERLLVGRAPIQAVIAASLAVTAREDVGAAVALLGAALFVRNKRPGAAFLAIGTCSTILALLVIRTYSGGAFPFDVRYAPTLSDGLSSAIASLERPAVQEYATTLLLSGGWLGLLSPLALAPALPDLALNVFSASAWMSAGKAHYSALVQPFVILGATAGLYRLRSHRWSLSVASAALVVTGLVGYLREGAGPLGGNYAPAFIGPHAEKAAEVVATLPKDAAVSATSALVPRVSDRSRVYVFPAVLDAEFVFVDLRASPAPTSAGDVYLHLQNMLMSGAWQLQTADDGLMVLHRESTVAVPPPPIGEPLAAGQGTPRLMSAELSPSLDGGVDVDGPRGILRTTWISDAPLRAGTQLQFDVVLDSGEHLHIWDVADLWWNPPQNWRANQPTTIDVPDISVRHFKSWQPIWSHG